MKTGILYLIPTLLSEENTGVIPEHTKSIVNSLDHFVVENEKSARHFLKAIHYPKQLKDVQMKLLNEHTKPEEVESLLLPLSDGISIGILSEAGCPAVADPGSDLVRLAHSKNITIAPLTGPSSLLLALMASGMNGQCFSFVGYLPRERNERIKAIRELERKVNTKNETQIFIEAPYRNRNLMEDLLQCCAPSLRLCIAADLTSPNQFVATKSISEWKKQIPDIQKKPVVFLMGGQ